MRIETGRSMNNLGLSLDTMEVPETGTYRSADGSQSRRYRAGDRVSRHEYELLQMAPDVVLGEEPDAKADAKPRNKKDIEPTNKGED